jgi:hypothetical protein
MVLPQLEKAPWCDLGARIVVMPREVGASDPRLARYSDHVLLLRPDRYVAACIPVSEVEEGAKRVAKMIGGTFVP